MDGHNQQQKCKLVAAKLDSCRSEYAKQINSFLAKLVSDLKAEVSAFIDVYQQKLKALLKAKMNAFIDAAKLTLNIESLDIERFVRDFYTYDTAYINEYLLQLHSGLAQIRNTTASYASYFKKVQASSSRTLADILSHVAKSYGEFHKQLLDYQIPVRSSQQVPASQT